MNLNYNTILSSLGAPPSSGLESVHYYSVANDYITKIQCLIIRFMYTSWRHITFCTMMSVFRCQLSH